MSRYDGGTVSIVPAEWAATDGGGTELYRLVFRQGQRVLDLCGHAHEGHDGAWGCHEARARLAEGIKLES